MDAATITALAALMTGIGAGPLLLKAWDVVWTALTGRVGKKRDEAEKLRALLDLRDAHIAALQGEVLRVREALVKARERITRLLNVNRDIRPVAA